MADSRITTSDPEVWTQAVGLEPARTEEPAGTEEAGEPLSEKFARFIRLCWTRRKMMALIVGAGIAISLAFALWRPNVYTSTTTLMPPDASSPYASILGLLGSSSSAASEAGDVLGLNTTGDLFISILPSRNVADDLVARFDLVHYFGDKFPDQARRDLADSTKIDQDRKSGMISISVTVASPLLAQKLDEGYVDELNRVVTDDSTSAARSERIFLEERVKDIKQDLDDSSRVLSQFSGKSKTIDIPTQAKSMVDAEFRLEGELAEGRSQLAALRQTYAQDNHLVKAAEARNAELQREIDELGGRPGQNGATAPDGNSAYPTVSELPGLGLTYYDLERKVRVDEDLWEELTKQYELAKVEEARQIPTVRVLDAAELPRLKSGPSRRNIVAIGALVSLVLACFLVFLLAHWEHMDPQTEPKKLMLEMAGSLRSRLQRRR
jgi:uncharacterized protein involved in exopolysaccharide biosynthesis